MTFTSINVSTKCMFILLNFIPFKWNSFFSLVVGFINTERNEHRPIALVCLTRTQFLYSRPRTQIKELSGFCFYFPNYVFYAATPLKLTGYCLHVAENAAFNFCSLAPINLIDLLPVYIRTKACTKQEMSDERFILQEYCRSLHI